jgi:integrase
MYTGHSFRRTSATLLANASGTDILDLKRHGGWKSGTVAEGYISESITNKIQVANKILHGNGDTEGNTKAQVFCDEIQN